MNNLFANKNRRVLVIDDNRAIHDDFRKILSPATATTAALHATEAALFGQTPDAAPPIRFEVDSAYQGQEGVLLAARALEAGEPYAVAFVDVRMPPGWDGVETTAKLWELDPGLQVVLCTAYSDYSWNEMFEKLDHSDGLLILKKPFDAVEAFQLAHALTEKWWLHQQSRQKVEELESRVAERISELRQTNDALQTEIVEHKRAETALRDSEARKNAIVQSSLDCIVVIDHKCRILEFNPAAEQVFGYARAEVLGRELAQVIMPPSLRERHRQGMMRYLATGEAKFIGRRVEIVALRSDGSEFPVELAITRTGDETSPTFTGFIRDITERKQAEEKLRRTEELYRRAIASAGAVPYCYDYATRTYLFIGEGIEELTGYSAREIAPGLWKQIIQESVMLGQSAGLEKEEAAQRVVTDRIREWHCDMRILMRDGKSRWISDVSVQQVDESGRFIGSMGILQDITERKRNEVFARALSRLGERLSSAASARGAFEIIREISRDLFAWDAFCIRLYSAQSDSFYSGFTVDTVNGQPVAQEQNDPEKPGELYRRIIDRGGELILRDQPSIASGVSPFGDVSRSSAVLMFVPIRSRGQVVGVLSVQSYTPHAYTEQDLHTLQTMADQCGGAIERIWADEALRKTEARLFQAQKMETVGKLAGGVAHEFNSILTAIIGQSELLRNGLPAGSPLARNASEISKAAHRAATLTRQLLAYGRKQFLQPETLDLNQVLADMEGILRHLMGDAVETRIVPAPGLPMVEADAGQIEQVIMNMAINARDAMPHGGKLTLETAAVTVDEEGAGRDLELAPGDYVTLAITDTGTGMSEAVKKRIFDPFFTTKDVGQGPGLGLPTCYGIIKQSGGNITFYSEEGRGTTFKIHLPQVQTPATIPTRHFEATDLPRGTETLLLVEDDPALREMAATLLTRLGYTVLTAANGVEALSLGSRRGAGPIDLLFTDVITPHMSGRELADRMRELNPHIRILFTSAHTGNTLVHQGILTKDMVLLQKPFTPSALAHAVRKVLDEGIVEPRTP